MEHSSGISLTKAYLNKPLCPCSKQTVALITFNSEGSPVHSLKVSEPLLNENYSYYEGSAVMYIKGKTQSLRAYAEKSTMVISGIKAPTNESILIFYTLEKDQGSRHSSP